MKPIDEYIRTARIKGKTDDEIRSALVAAGWNDIQARKALGEQVEELPPPPPPLPASREAIQSPTRPVSHGTNAWYAFEHILMFISLAVLAVSIALILNHFVDRYFPKVSAYESSYTSSYRSNFQSTLLRGYLASLIVSLPLFSFLFLDITKRSLTHPELRNLMIRKVLIYLTLIVTFVMILGYVIAAVYNFLGGDLTVNFLLHLLVTLVTSGSIFAYYLLQVKGDRKLNA